MYMFARLMALVTGQKIEEKPAVEKYLRNLTGEDVSDIAHQCIQRPMTNVTVTRPRWIAPWGQYIGEIRKTGTLTAEETRYGWTFYHPGFKGGQHRESAIAALGHTLHGNGFEIFTEL